MDRTGAASGLRALLKIRRSARGRGGLGFPIARAPDLDDKSGDVGKEASVQSWSMPENVALGQRLRQRWRQLGGGMPGRGNGT